MFQVIDIQSREVLETPAPKFIRKNQSGTWQPCAEADAQAVCVDGRRFELANTAILPADQISNFLNIRQKLNQQTADVDDIKDAINDITDAVLDIYQNGVS